MTLPVFFAVLAAALMHASWNALVKVRLDRFASISLTSTGMAVAAAPVLPFVAVPGPEVWPFIITSLIVHIGYRLFLARAYEAGDLAQTYPLARGSAPLMTTLGGIMLVGEMPAPLALAGIALLSFGTFLMSLRGGAIGGLNRHAVVNALITAVFITVYTLADGRGARIAETAASYAAWQFFLDGMVSLAVGTAVRGRALFAIIAAEWPVALLTGALSAGSYGIAMWAMTRTHIATVAALRESSILFALVIAVTLLGERVGAWRLIAAGFIIAGIIAIRLG